MRQKSFALNVNGPGLPQIQRVNDAPVTNITQNSATGSEAETNASPATKNTQASSITVMQWSYGTDHHHAGGCNSRNAGVGGVQHFDTAIWLQSIGLHPSQ